jgi:hypothetical protein
MHLDPLRPELLHIEMPLGQLCEQLQRAWLRHEASLSLLEIALPWGN